MNHGMTYPRLIIAILVTLVVHQSALAAISRHKATARLFGPTPLKGKAVYEERPRQGQRFQRFKVQVERGVPLQMLNVAVNGDVVGTIVLNAGGTGKLDLRTAAFIDDPHEAQPIPDGFPKLDTGDVVTVGPLTGIFFDRNDNRVQRFEVKGSARNGDGKAQVQYRERFKRGTLDRRFKVEVEDAAGVRSFAITVNWQFVGTLTTNIFGEGEFQLRTARFIDDPDDGQPMPNAFPSLKAGDVVEVGSITVTLVQRPTGGGGGGGGDGGGGGGDDPPGHN
jgi:hypothetical protein